MNRILVDTSVWISFLKGAEEGKSLLAILDSNLVCTNDLILAELIPSLNLKREYKLIELLRSVEKCEIIIDWNEIANFQTSNLRNGLNRIGIPDLIILQNAIQNRVKLFSLDKHFELMKKHIPVKLFDSK
jgi:predicted nucleic acid-binding protein